MFSYFINVQIVWHVQKSLNIENVLTLSFLQKVTCGDTLRWSHQSYTNSLGAFAACAQVQTPKARVLDAELYLDVNYCRTDSEKAAVVSAFETYIKSGTAAVPCLTGSKCTVSFYRSIWFHKVGTATEYIKLVSVVEIQPNSTWKLDDVYIFRGYLIKFNYDFLFFLFLVELNYCCGHFDLFSDSEGTKFSRMHQLFFQGPLSWARIKWNVPLPS